jgi:hypothetical protein
MLVLSCDEVPLRPLEPTQAAVGVDLGIVSFATTSEGQHVPNPGWGRAAAKLGTAQQVLVRKQRVPATVAKPERRWPAAIASSPTSGAASTTRWRGRWSPATACWWWRT